MKSHFHISIILVILLILNIDDTTAQMRKHSRNNFNKNVVSADGFDFVYQNITTSYERIIANGYLGFRVPFSFGILKNYKGKSIISNKDYSLGLDINVYVAGQRQISAFFGLGGEVGAFKYGNFSETQVKASNPQPLPGNYLALYINNGMAIKISQEMGVTIMLSLGAIQDRAEYYNYKITGEFNNLYPYADLGIIFNYKF